MTDLQSLIEQAAKYGDVGLTRDFFVDGTGFLPHVAEELLALVVKQGRMLEMVVRERVEMEEAALYVKCGGDAMVQERLADLARRVEEQP